MKLAPSILAADFKKLGEQVVEVERAGADRVHFDVMDGHFVPNLSMGPGMLASLRSGTKLPLEVHLMVEKPARFVDPFLAAGADSLIVHYEVLSETEAHELLRLIRSRGKQAGLSIKPGTAVEVIEPFLGDVDLVLCMTVEPGFGGQAFLPDSPARIRQIRTLIDRLNPNCELEVDGGIDANTIKAAHAAGANVFVAGTSIFRHPQGIAAAVTRLAEGVS